MASGNPAHWVEDLFPPTFSLTKHDLLEDKATSSDGEEGADCVKTTKDPRSKISPQDVAAIKNVYERVHLMVLLEEEERKKREDEDAKARASTPVAAKPLSPASAYLKLKSGITQKEESIDTEDSCIWNEGEIALLRKLFKHTKTQNAKLKAMVDVTSEKLKEVEDKCRDLTTLLNKRTKQLHDAQKANKRLQILCDNVKNDSEKQTYKCDKLEKDFQTVEQQNSELLKQLHMLQMELDGERLERKKIELEMEGLKVQSQREKAMAEENLKLAHQEDIAYLRDKIEEYAGLLDKEQREHERTKRGLQHLRNHFAALPMFNDVHSSSIVNKDQLSALDWKPGVK